MLDNLGKRETVGGRSGTEYIPLRGFPQVVSSVISFGFTVTSQENGMLLVTETCKKEWMPQLAVNYCYLILKMKEMVCAQEFLFANKNFSQGWCWSDWIFFHSQICPCLLTDLIHLDTFILKWSCSQFLVYEWIVDVPVLDRSQAAYPGREVFWELTFLLVTSYWTKMRGTLDRCGAWEASSSMAIAKQWKSRCIATKKYGEEDSVEPWSCVF